jgi:hypothetical protein
MSHFVKIPGTARVTNDLGVVVDFDRIFGTGNPDVVNLVAYEVDGARYWVRARPLGIGKEFHYEVDVSYAFQEGAPIMRDAVGLPKEVIDRMREDLPKAYAAFGRKCVVKQYKKDEFRRMAKSTNVTNDFGVVIDFYDSRDSISYMLDGIKYILRVRIHDLGGVDCYYIVLDNPNATWRDGACGKDLPGEVLDRIREDLPKACAAFFGRKCFFIDYDKTTHREIWRTNDKK